MATFSDNPGNRRLDRVGKPRDSANLAACMANVSLASEKEVYVDNTCNTRHSRVGKPLGTRRNDDFGQKVARVLKQLKADPGYDFENVDCDVAEAAADIYAREDTESTWRTQYMYFGSTDAALKTNMQSILAELPANKIIFSSEVKLIKRIGSGGFGDVFRGTLHGDIVAVKKIRTVKKDKWLRSFLREMKALLVLDHPNVVRFICASVEKNNSLIVTEYMEMSLWEALHVRQVQMTDEVKVDIAIQMWRGLDYLHEKNVVHGDVKSRNVLLGNVYNRGSKTVAKVSDFGLATVQDEDEDPEKLFNTEGFSPSYAAPEIIRGEEHDLDGLKRADVYSMALVILELFTETEPFNDVRSREHLIQMRKSGDMHPFVGVEGFQCDKFHALMNQCLNKSPEKRPTSNNVLKALEKLVNDGKTKE